MPDLMSSTMSLKLCTTRHKTVISIHDSDDSVIIKVVLGSEEVSVCGYIVGDVCIKWLYLGTGYESRYMKRLNSKLFEDICISADKEKELRLNPVYMQQFAKIDACFNFAYNFLTYK
jgi:hypothetical protein